MAKKKKKKTLKNPLRITKHKKARFLRRLRETGRINISADFACLSVTALKRYRAKNRVFAMRWDEALDWHAEMLEHEADRRAVEGVKKKIFTSRGNPVIDPETGKQYTETSYSDSLLMFRLKSEKPKKYRDRQSVEISGADGGPISMHSMSIEELKKRDPAELARMYSEALAHVEDS